MVIVIQPCYSTVVQFRIHLQKCNSEYTGRENSAAASSPNFLVVHFKKIQLVIVIVNYNLAISNMYFELRLLVQNITLHIPIHCTIFPYQVYPDNQASGKIKPRICRHSAWNRTLYLLIFHFNNLTLISYNYALY